MEIKLDVGKVEKAEKELDRFTNARYEAKQRANAEALYFEVEEKKRLKKRREENRREWISYYRRLHLVHQQCADEFAERVSQLQRTEETES